MAIIFKYKYTQGVASSLINSIIGDILTLHERRPPIHSNLKAYKKVASSEHLQNVYFEKTNSHYVQPQSLDKLQVNNESYELKYCATPLLPLINRLLSNQSLVDHLWEEQNQPRTSRQGQPSLENPLDASFAQRIRGKLKLEVYVDDTQYSPSYMNKTQKFTCIYLSLADIPFHLRTKRDEIDIYLLVNKVNLDKLGLNDTNFAMFSRLRSEIESINERGGIQLETSNGTQFTATVTISSIVGDNLAIYPLLGFSGCFNTSSFRCRFCLASGRSRNGDDSIQELFRHRPLATSDSDAEQHFTRLSNFIFDGLDGINRWNIAPPDIVCYKVFLNIFTNCFFKMHDLSEGVIPAILELILTNISSTYELVPNTRAWQTANRDLIITRFEKFHYFEGQPTLKWISSSGKNGFKLSGTALQKTETLMKLDAILFDIFHPQMECYQLYKLLRKFCQLSFALSFTEQELQQFEVLANEIVEKCTVILPDFSVFCKIHHLTHYGDLIRLFGPLYFYSSFR